MLTLLIACMVAPQQSLPERGACNPVDDVHCMLPFPNDFYRVNDQLSFDPQSLPINIDDVAFSPDQLSQMDGFSIGSTIAVSLLDATLEGTVQWPNLEVYLADDNGGHRGKK